MNQQQSEWNRGDESLLTVVSSKSAERVTLCNDLAVNTHMQALKGLVLVLVGIVEV